MKSPRSSHFNPRRSGHAAESAGFSGFTLLELLVAMSIMVFLGGALVTILKQGITAWHTAEKRGAIYERSRMVLDQVAEDLRAAAGDSRS